MRFELTPWEFKEDSRCVYGTNGEPSRPMFRFNASDISAVEIVPCRLQPLRARLSIIDPVDSLQR